MKTIDNFVSNYPRCMVQPFRFRGTDEFFWKIPISKNYHLEGVFTPRGGGEAHVLKQKLYIDWIFLFQSKILNFATIGFHPISLITFIKNLPYTAMLRNSKNLNSSRSFQSRTFKNNRVITSNISVILKLERSFYDDLFKRYCLHWLRN